MAEFTYPQLSGSVILDTDVTNPARDDGGNVPAGEVWEVVETNDTRYPVGLKVPPGALAPDGPYVLVHFTAA